MPSLYVLISKGIMKMCTVENVASSGLNLSHLKLIHKRKGEDGLHNVFQMQNSLGQPRVTGVFLRMGSLKYTEKYHYHPTPVGGYIGITLSVRPSMKCKRKLVGNKNQPCPSVCPWILSENWQAIRINLVCPSIKYHERKFAGL